MAGIHLTLAEVFEHPDVVTYTAALPTGNALLRPLVAEDVDALGGFLQGLSAQTRDYSIFSSYDRAGAQELCDAINRYDKLRFVLESPDRATIMALFEFSFDIPDYDLRRYAQYGVHLNARADCRFGPTIADEYQNQGAGSAVFPHLVDVARKFGKARVILWGGVFADNARAIRFYEKQGFKRVGSFMHEDARPALDMMLVLADYKV